VSDIDGDIEQVKQAVIRDWVKMNRSIAFDALDWIEGELGWLRMQNDQLLEENKRLREELERLREAQA
jgi:regulator of replication initiation timing